jgi:hypothetical protein
LDREVTQSTQRSRTLKSQRVASRSKGTQTTGQVPILKTTPSRLGGYRTQSIVRASDGYQLRSFVRRLIKRACNSAL